MNLRDESASDLSVCDIRKEGSISKMAELEMFMSLSCELFCCLNFKGQLLYVNQSWTKACGYTEETLIHTYLQSITVPEDTVLVLTKLLGMNEQGEAAGITIRLKCADSGIKAFSWNARRSGDLIYAAGHAVTEQQAQTQPQNGMPDYIAELPVTAALSEPADVSGQEGLDLNNELSGMLGGSQYLRAVIEKLQDAYCANYYSQIIDANEAFFNMTGYKKGELPDISFEDFVTQESLDTLYKRLPLLFTQGSDRFEAVNKRRDGSQLDVEVLTSVISKSPPVSVCFMRDISERKNSERELIHAHELMRYIIEHNKIAVAIHDKNLNYMYVSKRYIDFFGLEGKELIGRNHYEVMPHLPDEVKAIHKRVLGGEIYKSGETESALNPGYYSIWECRPWFEEDGEIGGLIIYVEEITERKRMERLLFDEKENFKTILLSVGDGVISTDNFGNITVMNPVAERLTGWTLEEAVGKNLNDVLKILKESTDKTATTQLMKLPLMGEAVEYGENYLVVSKSGYTVPTEISMSPVKLKDGAITGTVIVIRDFSEKRMKQRQIEFLSYHDELTGLYNRRYMEGFMSRLSENCSLPLTLMIVDVNGLKLTNDAFGHEMGDQLLRLASNLLKEACKPTDIICRMGGDEFCIILQDTDAEKAAQLKQKLLSKAAEIKMDNMIVSLAIGYAVKSRPEQELKAVMTAADNQMYQDKIKFGKAMRSQTLQTIININYEREQIHTERVSYYCEAIARAMNLSDYEIRDIKTAGALHDIGKIMVSPNLLNKPEQLTKEEYEIVKRHPETGYQLLKTVDEYTHLAEYVLYHHERWDGKGYPMGLEGENIPLYSRIIAVADAFEAMTAGRSYQTKKTRQEAAAELTRCAGTQFDPKIAELFVKNIL